MKKETYVDLLLEMSLRHLYNAEATMKDNLNTMLEAASSTQLKQVFRQHLIETQKQVDRLNQVFKLLDIDLSQTKVSGFGDIVDKSKQVLKTIADMNFTDRSKGMEGIISEGQEMLRHFVNTEAQDFALVASARKVEHFEIACYEGICSLIEQQYEESKVLDLLKTSLEEEKKADQMLAAIQLEYAIK